MIIVQFRHADQEAILDPPGCKSLGLDQVQLLSDERFPAAGFSDRVYLVALSRSSAGLC